MKKKKRTDENSFTTKRSKDFLDMIAPSVIKFFTDYFICGNTYRCVWALREYPTSTSEQAILRYLGEKDGVSLRIYTRHVSAAEEKRIKEIFMDGEAVCYGINPISGNMIRANRKNIPNPNGVILGTPGGGKSFATKGEISNVYLFTNDDIMICDPEDEYYPLVEEFNGQVIEIASGSSDHINPMDIDRNSGEDDIIGVKSEFLISLCEIVAGGTYGLESDEVSIIYEYDIRQQRQCYFRYKRRGNYGSVYI